MFVYGLDEERWLSPSGYFDKSEAINVDMSMVMDVYPDIAFNTYDYIMYDKLSITQLNTTIANKKYQKAEREFVSKYPYFEAIIATANRYPNRRYAAYHTVLREFYDNWDDQYMDSALCWVDESQFILLKIAGKQIFDLDAYRAAKIPIYEKYIARAESIRL